MRYRAKTGTVINIPKGATPEQIAKIKTRADTGYGKDAQKIANSIDGGGKKGKGNKEDTSLKTNNQNAISAAESYINSLIGNIKDVDLSGAPKLLSEGDTKAEHDKVYQANYDLATQGVEDQRKQDIETQKQELANRGIPYNPGTDPNDPANINNLYARSLNSVNQRYDKINSTASANATAAADSSLTAYVNANKTQNDQFLDTARTEYQSQLDQLAGVGGALGQLMQQYGLDQATAQAILDRKSRERIARIQNQRTGGSSGSSSSGDTGGFGIPGTGGVVT